MSTQSSSHGFTLIELLVVISIISLLSSVVLSSLGSARTRAQNSAINSQVGQWITALNISYSDYGGYYGSGTESFIPLICLGTTSTCSTVGGFNIRVLGSFNTFMSNYIAGAPNPNKDMIPVSGGSMRAYYAAYDGATCQNVGDKCSIASIVWFLWGNVNCPFGATRTTQGSNTSCIYTFQ